MADALTWNAAAAAERFSAARTVKSNPVREVRTDGEFYYKLDRRGSRALRCEFAAAQLLAARGFPAVEHLWCGRTPLGAVLVTRALKDAPTVRDYLWDHIPDGGFRSAFAGFVRDFLATGLDHRDMHVGNILYDLAAKRFVLVDVRGVRRFRWRRLPYAICRAPLELRRHLGKRELCAMLETIGVPDPERFFDRALSIEAAALRREWPKRRDQISNDYAKFVRREGEVRFNAFAAPEELAALEWRPGSAEEFCDSFYWDLAEIPQRRVLAFDPRAMLVGCEPPPPDSPLPPDELRERLRIFAK